MGVGYKVYSLRMKSETKKVVRSLTEESPSYQELLELYNDIRAMDANSPDENAAQYALAQILGEIVDYHDMVSNELEKSIGLSAESELDRILAEFSPPQADDPISQVGELVSQWRSIDRYDPAEVLNSFRNS